LHTNLPPRRRGRAGRSEAEIEGRTEVRFVRFLKASGRFLGSYGMLVLYLVLGIVAMAFFWWFFEDAFVRLQRSASAVRDWIVGAYAWPARVESIIRLVLDERQILLMGFVLATRLGIEIVLVMPIRALFGPRAHRRGAAPGGAKGGAVRQS
jgi:hypothetical protein